MPANRNLSGTLYVVGTPIGNLDDLSPRAREVLGRVDIVAAEDTRRTRGLLSHIRAKPTVIAYHDHNEQKLAPRLVARLAGGESIALVSDAGMPLVSDPGWALVGGALEAGLAVVSVPGPSAAVAALGVSGLPTDRFVFEGFLPRRTEARRSRLQALAGEARTMIFYESVHRLERTLAAMIAVFGADRRGVLARELTKVHESIHRGTLAELGAGIGSEVPLRGEFVVLVAGRSESAAPAAAVEVSRVYALLREALDPAKAVAMTAAIVGCRRNLVYRLTRTQQGGE